MEKNKRKDISNSLKVFEQIKDKTSIRFFGDEVLRSKCIKVKQSEFASTEINEICKDLTSAIEAFRSITGTGRGIAANQIGYNKRIVVIYYNDEYTVLINPKAINKAGKGSYYETCMSSGNLLTGKVIRPWQATFKYQDQKGVTHVLDADEKLTRILFHEIDHLNGFICLDRYIKKSAKYVFDGKDEIFGYSFEQIK